MMLRPKANTSAESPQLEKSEMRPSRSSDPTPDRPVERRRPELPGACVVAGGRDEDHVLVEALALHVLPPVLEGTGLQVQTASCTLLTG